MNVAYKNYSLSNKISRIQKYSKLRWKDCYYHVECLTRGKRSESIYLTLAIKAVGKVMYSFL